MPLDYTPWPAAARTGYKGYPSVTNSMIGHRAPSGAVPLDGSGEVTARERLPTSAPIEHPLSGGVVEAYRIYFEAAHKYGTY